MGTIKVFIADASEDFIDLLKAELEQEPGFSVAGTALTGDRAYAGIAACSPDVLVTDLLLTGLDGLSLLRTLKSEGRMPRTVVVSGFVNDRIAASVSRLGVKDYLPKPCSIRDLAARIRETAEAGKPDGFRSCEPAVTEALLNFGIMPHLHGYQLLREGVRRGLEDRSAMRGITKILYPDLAKQFHTTPQCVERSIRSAIDKAWKTGDAELRRSYFGGVFDSFRKAPTNARFISAIIEFLEMSFEKADKWK